MDGPSRSNAPSLPMSNNPYAPPGAKVHDRDPRNRRGSPWRAVFLGWLVDIGGTIVFASTVLALVAGAIAGSNPAALAALERSTGWQAFGLIFGMGFTALGGFVTARIANHSELRLAFLTGLFSLLTGEVLLQAGDADSALFWVRLAGLVCTIPIAMAGAWLYVQGKIMAAPSA